MGDRAQLEPDGELPLARAFRSHGEDRREAALAARDGEGSRAAPGGGRGGAARAAPGVGAARARGRGAQRDRARHADPRGPARARTRAGGAFSRRAGTRCCCRGSGATSMRCRATRRASCRSRRSPRSSSRATGRRSLHQETRGEGWLERRLEVPRDLVYLDGHYDGQPIVPAVVELRWVMEAAFDLLGSDASREPFRGAQVSRGPAAGTELRPARRAVGGRRPARTSGSTRARACSRRGAAAWPSREGETR